jgi:hypothetical protein
MNIERSMLIFYILNVEEVEFNDESERNRNGYSTHRSRLDLKSQGKDRPTGNAHPGPGTAA